MKKAVSFLFFLLLNIHFSFAQEQEHLPNDRLYEDRGEKIQKVFGDQAAQFHYDHRMNAEFIDRIKDLFFFDLTTLMDVKKVMQKYVDIQESTAFHNQKFPNQPTNAEALEEVYIQRVLRGNRPKNPKAGTLYSEGLQNESTTKTQVSALLTFMELMARDSQYAGAALGIEERHPRAFAFLDRLRKDMGLVPFDPKICTKVLDEESCVAQVKPAKRAYAGPRAQY
jgi:hypothetical protein